MARKFGSMALYYDPGDRDRKTKANALTPIAGYCVFVDIVNSTKMKDGVPPSEWCERFALTFYEAQDLLRAPARDRHNRLDIEPLKIIGDEAMYFIPETAMKETPVWFFQGLCCIATWVPQDVTGCRCRIGVAHCQNVYPITFRRETPEDFYGKGIDLASRLVKEAEAGEVVMNQPFYTRVKADFERQSNPGHFPDFSEVDSGQLECLKGFASPVKVYRCRPKLR